MDVGAPPEAPEVPIVGRLPAPASSFIGRTAELAAVAEARSLSRLVTITGPGGAGKTRLAIEAVRSDAAARTVFVDLTRITDGGSVGLAVANAAGIRAARRTSALGSILWWLEADGEALLVLDNAEHVLAETAALVVALLEGAATCRILLTSRQPLRVAGERVVPVGPMLDDEAASLFWERALAVRAALPVTPASRAAAAELCERLDRLPLALELAAARMAVLTPAEMLPMLDRRFEPLASGPPTAPARHRSLRACIASSVEALNGRQREVFEACSVFASPFDARAAAAVVDASLTDLEDLVSRSLLQSETDPEGRTTFRLLESPRELAREGLDASGMVPATRRRHLAWMVAEFGGAQYPTIAESSRYATPSYRLPELRAALDYASEADPASGLALMASSRDLWFRVAQDEGLLRVRALLDRYPRPDAVRGGGLVTAALLHNANQQTDLAHAASREALTIFEPNTLGAAMSHYLGAVSCFLSGDVHGAIDSGTAAVEAFTAVGDDPGRGRAMSTRGTAFVIGGRPAEAVPALLEALEVSESAGDGWSQGQILTYLGIAESDLHRDSSARAYLAGAVEHFSRVGDISLLGIALARLAAIEVRRNPLGAVRAAASAARREGAGGRYHVITLGDIDAVRSAAEREAGAEAVAAAWREGERLSMADAAAALRAHDGGRSPSALTPRELEVAELVRRGHTNGSIARRLGVSERTVENHVAHATAKLGVRNRAALAAWAAERDHATGG
ncbi:LuxR C-terminal-related transcriptional regulator [Sinomonas sp. ASV486]|uniref:ATP-binding protein n=1 Tax=Sinomonas sp. ASV486 TaxID=3051170 RepID=UPI0027DDBFCF|nr:LuxR C-terminal-related transcriptional regulator [Sinomonas sp. ASV486]MDQ4491641.1 LuxR C-terminal-related transcriptional regulator [Sinomonas sp. ASV486]